MDSKKMFVVDSKYWGALSRELDIRDKEKEKQEEQKRIEEARLERKRREEEKAMRRAAHEKEFMGEGNNAGLIERSIARQDYYQQETGFVHDGLITMTELREYEAEIHKKKEASKPFIKSFRHKVTEMMMVDKRFANVMTEYSPEYKKLAKAAKKQEEKLEWKANVSGLNKAVHCVGKKERDKARNDLKKLREARESRWRTPFSGDEETKKWRKEVCGVAEGLRFEDIFDQTGDYCREIANAAGTHDAFSDVERAPLQHEYSKVIKKADKLKISTSDVISLTYENPTRRVQWQDVLEDTKLVINAYTDKVALSELSVSLRDFGEQLRNDEFISKLRDEDSGIPDAFLDGNVRDSVWDRMKQCDHIYSLLHTLSHSPAYDKLSKEEKLVFEEARSWAVGNYRYLKAAFEQLKAWNHYYNTPKEKRDDIPPEKRPRPLDPMASYYK
ncbi:MAG: hypothetical protein K6E91_11595 [Butyrivibrio sp.]|nr:hypothetical protein [Butyrivibrio sp.]